MNRALEILLAVVVAGSVLALGGVLPIAYSLMEIALLGAWLVVLVRETWQGRVEMHLPLWPALFALWVAIQLLPLPAALVRRLQPARFAGIPSGVQPAAAWLTLSIYPHATWLTWIRFLAYLAAFVLAARVFDSRKRQSLLVRVLIGLGLFEAAYGIVQYLTGWQKIFTYTRQYYLEDATGTYINHNHYAGFLELTLPFVLGSVFYYFQMWQENRRAPAWGRPRQAASAGFQALVYAFLLVIIAVAVLFSRSRGGILAAAFSIVFIALLAQLRTRRKTWMLGLGVFLVLAVGYGLWIGLGPVLTRFEELGLGAQEFGVGTRFSFWRDALGMIRDYRWTGTGLGTFAIGFRPYQTAWLNYFVDHVHNDYVEFAAETGWVGAALLFLPMAYLLIRMILSFVYDSRRYRPSILLGCVGSVLALLLHSATDFNLQIPANALVLAVVLGIGYKAACLERRDEKSERERAPSREAVRVASGTH